MEKSKGIKDELLRRAKYAGACTGQYKRALEAQSLEELAQVIKDNFSWCCFNKVLDVEIINQYAEEFVSVEIYANASTSHGYVLIDSKIDSLQGTAIAYMYGNALVGAMWENASVVEMRGNALVVEMRDNASVGEMYDNALVVEMRDNASVGEMYSSASVGDMWDNASVGKMRRNASVVEMHGNASVSEMYDNAYISTYYYIECKISDNAIMRVRSENKIYTNTAVERPNNN